MPLRTLRDWTAAPFFWLNLLYVATLVVLLISRRTHWLLIDRIPDPIGGLVPIAIPWFGALGAVMISLYGVFDWNRQWDARWNYWHAARPLVGATFAVIAFLIFIGIINATGAQATIRATNARDNLPYLVLAFIVGFREQTFRALLQRAVDIILGPGIPGQTPTSVVVTAQNRVARISPTPETVAITVTNAGGADVTVIRATPQVSPANAATVRIDGLEAVTVGAMSHVTGQATITASATANMAFNVTVTIEGSFGTRSLVIERTQLSAP
jgi:hypothetical protein